MTPVLDRIPSKPDPVRRELFNVANLEVFTGVTVAELEPRSYTWSVPFHLNQRSEGACVPHGCIHEAVARPKPVDFRRVRLPAWALRARQAQTIGGTNKEIAQELALRDGYDWCRDNDEWAGRNYSGTSAAAGARMMANLGLWLEYRWATSVRDFCAGFSRFGPGCLAIDWYTGMMKPDADGFIWPTGRLEGGHQILAMSYAAKRFKRPAVGLWQSWGDMPVWWIYVDKLEEIVQSNGEMVLPTVRSL